MRHSLTYLKYYHSFNEVANGTDMAMKNDMGGVYLTTPTTLSSGDTNVLMGMDDNLYTEDEYLNLYNEYLKNNKPLPNNEFNKMNLDIVLSKLK